MPRYDKQLLSKQAKELNFIRDTFEKVRRLSDVLGHFQINPILSKTLALKGGTAINLTVFNLPRLSVDIDLDYTINNSRDEMLENRSIITDTIKKYMYSEGYEYSNKSKTYHSLDSFVFTYINSGGVKDNIKIEINYSLRCHILPLVNKDIETLGVLYKTKVLSLNHVEIFASKIVALVSRVAARDLYDVYNMIHAGIFDESEEELLRKCIVFYGGLNDINNFNIDKISKLGWQKIRTDLLPVIKKKEKFDLESAKKKVHKYLTKLLVLSDKEKKYLNELDNSRYRPELLFNGDNLERVKRHPMALWKIRNK